jgi:hypothetical protein
MKIPRIFSNRLGKWFPLALLVLPVLAARTLIVASEEPDDPGTPTDSPTRFVMSDEGSEAESAPQPDLLAPNAASSVEPRFYTTPHPQFAQPAMIQQASPAVREAVQPMWQPDEDQSFWDASWEASYAAGQAMDAVSFARQGFAEPPPQFQQSAQSVVQQAYNPFDENGIGSLPLAEGAKESVATQFTVQVPEDRVTRLLYQEAPDSPPSTADIAPAIPAPAEAPEMPSAPVADTGAFAPATPEGTQIDTPPVPAGTDVPASPSDQAALLPTVEEQPPAAILPPSDASAATVPSGHPPVDPAPFVPEPEALPSDPYGLMPESGAFEQPAMPADCGMACPLTWYARAELMYVQRRTEDHISLTDGDFNGLDRMDFAPGGRVTIGRIGDCLDGFELVYTGGFEWTERSRMIGPNLNPKFTSGEFNISSFRNAQVHTQEYRSDFHSVELNRKWWGWDVISTTVGIRYMYVGEKYRFDSLSLRDGVGSLKMAMDNHYIGPQLGLDLYRPIGRWTTEIRSKAGIFLNYVDFDYSLDNAGVNQFSTGSEKGQFGFEAELGLYAKYQLLPRLSIQAGYEFWYLYGVATPTSQNRSRIKHEDGAYSEDDIFYHGGSLGLEMIW